MLETFEAKLFWILIATVAIYFYLKYLHLLSYWQRHGVPCEPPSILLGNIPISYFFGISSIGALFDLNYAKFCKHPFHGFYIFHKPAIVINDPKLIKTILIREFHRFSDRGWFSNDKIDPLSGHLFRLPGEKWRRLRAKLSPLFTSSKLKQMYQLVKEVSNEMIDTCEVKLRQSDILDVNDIIGRYTVDIISSVVYGLKCNSLKTPDSEFYHNGLQAIAFNRLSLIVAIFAPDYLEKLKIPLSKKYIETFFINTFKDTVDYRRKEKIVKKDFLNLLMELMDYGEDKENEGKPNEIKNKDSLDILKKLNILEAAAQAYVFFVAGYEPSSSAATYALLELALNPEIQDNLREEIDEMVETTGINYDSLMTNEYLEMVLTETLRKHASLPLINRICIEDFPIPNSNYTIPKGMRVIISASGVHHNPEFYPDPDKFDPMRFSKENAAETNNYVDLGFGEGPRYCIGKRFGQLQAKLAIVTLLRNYKFYVCKKTPKRAEYATNMFIQSPASSVCLRAEKRNL